MPVFTKKIQINTHGDGQIIDITDRAQSAVQESGLNAGLLTAFVPGSTAGITTIENEPGLIQDLQDAFDRLVPKNLPYEHHKSWGGEDNGHSHVRAAMIGPSVTVPFTEKKLLLGTWQQLVLIDFDTRSRNRSLVFQILGE